jgi:hypothetical protein
MQEQTFGVLFRSLTRLSPHQQAHQQHDEYVNVLETEYHTFRQWADQSLAIKEQDASIIMQVTLPAHPHEKCGVARSKV